MRPCPRGAHVYVTSFRHLTLAQPIPDFIELMPGMRITTDNGVRRRLLTEDFRVAAGAIETDYLWSAPNLVFGEFEANELQGLPADRFLLCVILWIDGLFRNCWLLHDHCMECDAAFLMSKQGNRRWTATRNYLPGRATRANGSLAVPLSLKSRRLQRVLPAPEERERVDQRCPARRHVHSQNRHACNEQHNDAIRGGV